MLTKKQTEIILTSVLDCESTASDLTRVLISLKSSVDSGDLSKCDLHWIIEGILFTTQRYGNESVLADEVMDTLGYLKKEKKEGGET